MEISHIFTQYFHLSNRVIPAHRMSRWKILFLFKGMVRMMHETRNHHRVMRVARQLPALNDQNQRRDFWEGSCLYLAINQTQGKGRGWRLLQVMDCWLATILISPLHLTSLHSDGYFCISVCFTVSGPEIFSSLTVEMDSLLALPCMKSMMNICYQIWYPWVIIYSLEDNASSLSQLIWGPSIFLKMVRW